MSCLLCHRVDRAHLSAQWPAFRAEGCYPVLPMSTALQGDGCCIYKFSQAEEKSEPGSLHFMAEYSEGLKML